MVRISPRLERVYARPVRVVEGWTAASKPVSFGNPKTEFCLCRNQDGRYGVFYNDRTFALHQTGPRDWGVLGEDEGKTYVINVRLNEAGTEIELFRATELAGRARPKAVVWRAGSVASPAPSAVLDELQGAQSPPEGPDDSWLG